MLVSPGRRCGWPAVIPSTGLRVAEGVPAPQAVQNDHLAPPRGVRESTCRRSPRKHVLAHVVHHLQTLDSRIGIQNLGHLLQHGGPGVGEHAARGVDHEDDVLAVDRDPSHQRLIDRTSFRLLLETHHLGGQLLSRGHESTLDDVADFRLLIGRRKLTLDSRQISSQARDLLVVLRQLLLATDQLSVDDRRLATDLEDLLLQPSNQGVELDPRLFDRPGLADLTQHQQQHDRAEPTTDHVQERKTEALEPASPLAAHGQSSDRLMNDPRVAMASCQNELAARGSPSIGYKRTFMGTPRGTTS